MLYQYKRDEPPAIIANNLSTNTSSSFKYKIDLLGDPVVDNNVARRNLKVVVPLKYLSNFFRSLEMPLINCKIKLNLTLNLLSMIQNYMFQLLLCQKKIIKTLLNNKIKVFKDLFIGMNKKQKNKLWIRMLIMLILLGILV